MFKLLSLKAQIIRLILVLIVNSFWRNRLEHQFDSINHDPSFFFYADLKEFIKTKFITEVIVDSIRINLS